MRKPRAADLLLGFMAVALAGGAAPAAAQVAGADLRGVVRDSAGAPVADVQVEVRTDAGRVLAGTSTDQRGRFLLLGVPAGGPYVVVAERFGFRLERREGVHLTTGQDLRLDITLESLPLELPGIHAVAARDSIFSRSRTGASTVLEQRVIGSAPTVERDVTALAALSPMVAIEDRAISVAGQNTRFNALRVDGTLAQDVFGLSPTGVPGGQANARPLPMDAIRQYAVLVAPFDVRQSGFTGGLLNATTRSGGEEWEGAAFGYYRDGAFSGIADDSDQSLAGGRGATEEFRTELGGFTLSGPVGPARVFVAGEVERRRRPTPGLHLGGPDPVRVGLAEDSVARLVQILEDQYGMAAGATRSYTLENPLGNLFVRGDVPIAPGHDVMLRYNGIWAEEDVPAAHLGFGAYELGSAGTRITSRTHSVAGRVVSRLGESTRNEVVLNVQHTEDATRAASDLPQVEVTITSQLGGDQHVRPVRAGGDPLAHGNELTQRVVQLADNLSHGMGDHVLAAGVEASWFSATRSYLPSSRGIWRFNNLGDLEANVPWAYERLVLAPGADPAVEVRLLQLSGYVQDEWSPGSRFTLRGGLRVDVPTMLTEPGRNPTLTRYGLDTRQMPATRPLFSPRLGFNWQPPLGRTTQVRGGIGVFTGVPPLAWIADAYASTGMRTAVLECSDHYDPTGMRTRVAPPLDLRQSPSACLASGIRPQRDVTVLADDFRFPQDFRASLGVDHELPGGLVGTVEAVYTRAINQVSLADVNLAPAADSVGPTQGYPAGIGGRPFFGIPLTIPHRYGPLAPDRIIEDYGRVIHVGNHSRNAALAVAAELRGRFGERLDARLAYTFTRAVDTRSLLYPDAALNYGHSPIRGDPASPPARPAAFDRPHRVLVSTWARLAGWGRGLDATVTYIGQSGLPYSYVYESDMNGDGYPGPGAAADAYNDLYYVPRNQWEAPGSIASAALLAQLHALEPCMGAAGAISERNSCRAPWANRLDLRLSQGIPIGRGEVRVTGDIMNVLNLLNRDWGIVHTVPAVVPVLRVDRRSGCPGSGCGVGQPLIGYYTGPRRRDPVTGGTVAELPYVQSLPDSQWRAQLGVRVAF